MIAGKTESRLQNVGDQRLAVILVCVGTVGTVAPDNEASDECKEDVENGLVLQGPIQERLRCRRTTSSLDITERLGAMSSRVLLAPSDWRFTCAGRIPAQG